MLEKMAAAICCYDGCRHSDTCGAHGYEVKARAVLDAMPPQITEGERAILDSLDAHVAKYGPAVDLKSFIADIVAMPNCRQST